MDQWRSILDAVLARLGPYGPRAAGAAAIVAAAWLFARLARAAAARGVAAVRLEERLRSPGLAGLLSNIAFWLVWLFALPALLGTLELEGLLAPVNAMMSRMLGFLPNLMGGAAVFGIGFLAAKILREVVSGLLAAAGSEKLAARVGMASALGEKGLSGLVGSVVFTFVLLPTLSAALQTVGLDSVAKPVEHLLDTVVELIPRLISAAVIVAVGAIVGRVLAGIVTSLVAGVGINRFPARIGLSEKFRLGGRDASELVGGAVMLALLLIAVTQACEVLGFKVLTEAVAMLGAVLAKLAAAVVILLVGLWLSTLAARSIAESAVANAETLGQVVRGAILFFIAALTLRQAGLPGDIVTIAFGSVVGGIAIGLAVALGVGGRHVAGRLLEAAVATFQRKRENSGNDDE